MNSPSLIPSVPIFLVRGTDQPVQRIGWPSLDEGTSEMTPLVPMPSEPHVELQSMPDGAGKIIVTCTCGRRIEVACDATP
jgi:hypothetical protein